MNRFDDSEDWVPPSSTRIGGNRPRRNYNYQRPPKWRLLIFVVALVIIILLAGYLFLFNRLQSYTPFTDNMKVAQVTVLQSREGLHQLSVQVIRIDANGYQKVDKPYLIQGDKVELKYEYVTLPDWLGFFGLHSGYMLTSLQGVYNNGTTGTSQSLGTADQDQSPLVSPQFKNITFIPGGKPHALYISQTGLYEP